VKRAAATFDLGAQRLDGAGAGAGAEPAEVRFDADERRRQTARCSVSSGWRSWVVRRAP